jgi:putative transposase
LHRMGIPLPSDYYHIYNRGVERKPIYQDQQDYGVFLSYLKEYLSQKDEKELRKKLSESNLPNKERDKIWKLLKINNFFQEITLLVYCLMPNHFHFFIKVNDSESPDNFMRSLCTRYAMYFNHKYKRVGPLFQGRYKSVRVTNDGQFLQLSRYIHKQALNLQGRTLHEIHPSSYSEYAGKRNTDWVHPEEILEYFSKNNSSFSYEYFVKEAMQGPSLQGNEEDYLGTN